MRGLICSQPGMPKYGIAELRKAEKQNCGIAELRNCGTAELRSLNVSIALLVIFL